MPNQSKTKLPETLADALAEFQKQVKAANREGTAKDRGNKERKYSTLEDLLKYDIIFILLNNYIIILYSIF